MQPFTKSEIAIAIAANSNFTAHDAEDIIEVISAVIQKSIQDGNTVDFLGLGIISASEGKINFEASEILNKIVKDPEAQIKILNVRGMLPTDLWTNLASIYKHRVNVGC